MSTSKQIKDSLNFEEICRNEYLFIKEEKKKTMFGFYYNRKFTPSLEIINEEENNPKEKKDKITLPTKSRSI